MSPHELEPKTPEQLKSQMERLLIHHDDLTARQQEPEPTVPSEVGRAALGALLATACVIGFGGTMTPSEGISAQIAYLLINIALIFGAVASAAYAIKHTFKGLFILLEGSRENRISDNQARISALRNEMIRQAARQLAEEDSQSVVERADEDSLEHILGLYDLEDLDHAESELFSITLKDAAAKATQRRREEDQARQVAENNRQRINRARLLAQRSAELSGGSTDAQKMAWDSAFGHSADPVEDEARHRE